MISLTRSIVGFDPRQGHNKTYDYMNVVPTAALVFGKKFGEVGSSTDSTAAADSLRGEGSNTNTSFKSMALENWRIENLGQRG